ncbi:probable ribonuclease 11 [Acomys russatus]|uniref:probable ribonuclease 11 n=1 Tax=Acomys russatus TaxID=60746 RepID=UPI0021E1D374|nr:probable ribonuclease 11 [Acomys russatus]
MALFLLLLGLGLVLVAPSESTAEGITEKTSQEEMQRTAKWTVEESVNSTLSDKNISPSISKDVMSAPAPTPRRFYFVILKGNTSSNDKNCLSGLVGWRNILEVNESCQLGSNNFIPGRTDVMRGVPKATSWKCGQTRNLSCLKSLGLEHAVCKVTAGQQCPRCPEHRVTSLKRILTVLTSHSLMSWLVSGSKL